MSAATAQRPKQTSLRDRVKDKLLSPSTSLRLPKFLSNEPASPARYTGTAISPGYVSPLRNGSVSSGEKEQWYFPPDPPSSPKPKRTKQRASRSRGSEPNVAAPQTQHAATQQYSEGLHALLSPRIAASSPRDHYPFGVAELEEEPLNYKPLGVHDLRNEKKLLYGDVKLHSGLLYNLIQTIPAVWLTTPKIKESFIPLLRVDKATAQQRAPTPTELRLIDGFLTHVPDIHIIAAKRIHRKPSKQPPSNFKRALTLSSDLVDEFDKSTPRTQTIYSLLIIATLVHEISLWIIHQLIHSDTVAPAPTTDDASLVQHCIFGGVLLLETHVEEDPQLAFVDLEGVAWEISLGWLLFKFAEGPGGMPFVREKRFLRRRSGIVKRVGGAGGGLEGF